MGVSENQINMLKLQKEYKTKRISWATIDYPHVLWINGEPRTYLKGISSRKAKEIAQSEIKHFDDWQKEIHFISIVEFETKIASYCAKLCLKYLSIGQNSIAKQMGLKTIQLEKRNRGDIKSWKKFSELVDSISITQREDLRKWHRTIEDDGEEDLKDCEWSFLCRAFPIDIVSNIQPNAFEAFIETLKSLANSKINWFYDNEGSAVILTTADLLDTSQCLEKLRFLINYLQFVNAESCEFDAMNKRTFDVLEKVRKLGAETKPLVYYFESVKLLELEKTSFYGDCQKMG